MVCGIDIGGTHTDAVCLHEGEIVSLAKVVTADDLVGSILGVVENLGVAYGEIQRVVLSTTLSTNAIIVKNYPPTGMIVSAGPGIDPRHYFLSDDFYLVDGAIDHRGREYIPIREEQVRQVSRELRDRGVRGVGVVSKFSVRNSLHERRIAELIADDFTYLTMGNRMGGALNFPRRLHTTYFNTAMMPIQERFVKAVRQALSELGIHAPLLFLKADGGTYSSAAADRLPVETIMSGPAASMMGALALGRDTQTTLVLDIGGTTTDIGLLIGGIPILEPMGVSVGGLKTLVRGLHMLSVGAGGDSAVRLEDGRLQVGPARVGPPVVLGGAVPTPTDALAVLDQYHQGDRSRAEAAIGDLAARAGEDVVPFARRIVDTMVGDIHAAALGYVDGVNRHPVYTIHEMLNPQIFTPSQVMVIGGPAEVLRPRIEEVFGMRCVLPPYSRVANALGAALARTTAQITLTADTQLRRVLCPELDIDREVEPRFGLGDLKEMGFSLLRGHTEYLGLADDVALDVVEEQSFNMVRGFSTTGRNMRVRIQSRPGLINGWRHAR